LRTGSFDDISLSYLLLETHVYIFLPSVHLLDARTALLICFFWISVCNWVENEYRQP